MTNADEQGDSTSGDDFKSSRTARWKNRLNRTKSKLKRRQDNTQVDSILPKDVQMFLQPGHSLTVSPDDALPFQPMLDHAPPRDPQPPFDMATRTAHPTTRDDTLPSHPAPHRQHVLPTPASASNANPDRTPEAGRSRAHSAIRSPNRRRNLSVNFSGPPVIIGLGGEDAEEPSSHILKPRARSVSPMPPRWLRSPRAPSDDATRAHYSDPRARQEMVTPIDRHKDKSAVRTEPAENSHRRALDQAFPSRPLRTPAERVFTSPVASEQALTSSSRQPPQIPVNPEQQGPVASRPSNNLPGDFEKA